LTSAANHEISKSSITFALTGTSTMGRVRDRSSTYIIDVTSFYGFIQEGSDNVDLNTETIDGKTTFHAMARAIFQVISNQPADLIKIKRGQENIRIQIFN
jgi:hypothetical protein